MIEFLATYNLNGIFIGIATFLIIGIFHPLVIKGEYHFGVKCWWVFALMGIISTSHQLWSKNSHGQYY